jgi:hypothetical protein
MYFILSRCVMTVREVIYIVFNRFLENITTKTSVAIAI